MLGPEALRALFLAMPPDGSWMRGTGIHSPNLMMLLDENSPYVEERVMPDDKTNQVEWMVRLTDAGILARAKILSSGPKTSTG